MGDRFVNVVAEGPLANWHVSTTLRVDHTTLDVAAPTLRALDSHCIDWSNFFPLSVFPPEFVERHTKKELRSPLEVLITLPQAVPLSDVSDLQLNLSMRKARTASPINVHLDKFQLHWARDIAAAVGQALSQIVATSTSNPTTTPFIGMIEAPLRASSMYVSSLASQENLFLRWETDAHTGRVLEGQSLLIEHSAGMVWRVINISRERTTFVWALDSMVAFVTVDELAGTADTRIEAHLQLMSAEGVAVRLGVLAEQVLSIDASPIVPLRTIRVVNGSWKQIPLSSKVAAIGWTLRLVGSVTIPPHESCAHGEVTQNQHYAFEEILTQQTLAAASSDRLKRAEFNSVVELASTTHCKWFGRKTQADTFQLLYALYSL